MTYSPLTDETRPPTGRYQGQPKWSARPAGGRITGLNVHHWAGTSLSGLRRLVESNDPASANYLILTSGRLIGSVSEKYRAWTTSSYANDADKITVEIQNESGAPSWRISDAAMTTLIRLYADIARRYGFTPTRARLKGHQEYGIATACPGPYLLPRLDDVARQAQQGADLVTNPVKPLPPTRPAGKLVVDGVWGSATTAALQRALGTTADGIVSSQSATWRDRNSGLTTGWQWVRSPRGSRMIIALQKRLGVKADGLIGPGTIRALQKRLGTPADGEIWRPSTAVRALQRTLNEGKLP